MALFEEKDIPWDDIAFRTIALSLRHYFEDRRRGSFGTHNASIALPPMATIP